QVGDPVRVLIADPGQGFRRYIRCILRPATRMYFSLIVEEQYRHDSMPMVIAERLLQWGHTVDLLEPSETVTCLSDLTRKGYDAYVLKTVAGGPGLSILQAAEAHLLPSLRRRRSEEHTSELQSRGHLVCRLLLEKK